MTERKIRIRDNEGSRKKITEIYEAADKAAASRWALSLAQHLIGVTMVSMSGYPEIEAGFAVIESWQKGEATVASVRKASLKIHGVARFQDDELTRTVLRTAGHAVASGHMKEHALVASDYAIKAINIWSDNDMSMVDSERKWQLDEFKRIFDKQECKV